MIWPEALTTGRTYERCPSSYPMSVLCNGKAELTPPGFYVTDAREEAVVDKTCNLLEVGNYCLGEPFVVADFMKEVVTTDNDNLSA